MITPFSPIKITEAVKSIQQIPNHSEKLLAAIRYLSIMQNTRYDAQLSEILTCNIYASDLARIYGIEYFPRYVNSTRVPVDNSGTAGVDYFEYGPQDMYRWFSDFAKPIAYNGENEIGNYWQEVEYANIGNFAKNYFVVGVSTYHLQVYGVLPRSNNPNEGFLFLTQSSFNANFAQPYPVNGMRFFAYIVK